MTAELSKYRKGVNVLSINNIIVANKKYSLPKDYSPQESSEARDAFYKMNKDAQKSGLNLKAFSTYRSYEYQDRLFKSYVKEHGEKEANRFSAKPGESEHQTGLAFDIGGDDQSCWANKKFNNTKEAKWLYENAYKYGFILRYPEGKEDITGYMYESWHYRYVGTEHSKNFAMNNLTLEEYLHIN
ncbi:D-alanyl-D-alanine carboxypeptidase family protein [Clostridioides difficile P68]|nr:D-alanyl-D-alanine carboxypeptidase family protein [Clostridioides difficile P13]EQJ79044.1 D-alanyl-D-alanine carboxypeptidase family protein [Clostridioides difficile P46]ERM42283.1 D-alanyl-D-alanine carboxypeptidase family protein [Clostridioides difficile P68]